MEKLKLITMKRIKYLILAAILFVGYSCTEEVTEIQPEGNPILEIENTFANIHFGDEIYFTANVSDEISLSTLTAKLYFGEEEVSETIIRTKENGVYSGSVSVPFEKNIPDGTATLEFRLLNTTLNSVTKSFDVPVSRVNYPYLILVTEDGSYPMLPTDQPNEYAASEAFPSTDLPAYIKTPVIDDKAKEIVFGWEAGAVTEGVSAFIPFVSPVGGTFSVTFNTLTYEATPFFEILLNEQKMQMLDKENFELDVDLTQGQEINIDGLEDLEEWRLDHDFFIQNEEGSYNFTPITGRYRITANVPLKYFKVEVLDGNSPASLKDDGTGAVWIIGEHIGKPSVEELEVGWEPSRALCMAPIGNKKYQITFVGGQSIRMNEINFKFFHQKDWGGEFGSETISSDSEIIFIGDGDNGRDNGNLGIVPDVTLEQDASYVFVVDLSNGIDAAVLTVTKN